MKGHVEWQLAANFPEELVYQTTRCHIPQGSISFHHREYRFNNVYYMSRSKRSDTLIGKETGTVIVDVGGTHTYHRSLNGWWPKYRLFAV